MLLTQVLQHLHCQLSWFKTRTPANIYTPKISFRPQAHFAEKAELLFPEHLSPQTDI